MQFGRQVEWTLHCCIALSELQADTYLSTRELASMYHLPKEYLSKGLQALSRAGLLVKAMGPLGGYRLSRPPADITVLEVVEAIEGNRPIFRPTWPHHPGVIRWPADAKAAPSLLEGLMERADEAWRSQLRKASIADISGTKHLKTE